MKRITLLFMILSMLSCKKTEIAGFHDKPVVESYLYADSIPRVKISKLVPFSTDMAMSTTEINQLEVTITEQSSGKAYKLASLGQGIYENKDLKIVEGNNYQLSFPYNGLLVTASTTIPGKPLQVTLSATSMIIARRGEPGLGGGGPPTMPTPITIKWNNTDQGYYLLVAKNTEKIREQINVGANATGAFFRNQPTNTGSTELNSQSFKYYGYHLITLFKIQPEYVIFFQETSNSSLSLTEITANIKNGYGIFTGINCFETYVLVGKP